MPCLQLLPPSPSIASVSEAWVLVEILHIRLASLMVSAPVHKIFISDFISLEWHLWCPAVLVLLW